MFRVKVTLVSVSLVAFVTAVVYWEITTSLDRTVTKAAEASVSHAQQQLLRSSRLEALDLTTLTAGFAHDEEFAQIFTKPTEREKRVAALNVCDMRSVQLEKEGHKVGVIAVTDASGKVVARDRDESFSWHSGEDLGKLFPSLGLALVGSPNKDVWDLDGSMYRVGSAAIKNAQGQVVGAVFVGDVQSTGDATTEAARSGVDVAYFYQSKGKMKIHASSLKGGVGGSEGSDEKTLAEQIFDPAKKLVEQTTERHGATELFQVKINGEEWVAAAGPIYGNIPDSQTKSGFVVLTSMTAARAPVMSTAMMILALGLMGILASIAAAVGTARRFLGPLDKIEAGVAEVINGNRDYVFESPSPDFEGLANGLGVMLARVLGRPEPGEEEASEEGVSVPQTRWQGDSLFVDEAAAAGGVTGNSAEMTELAAEAEEIYYARIWREYAAARQQTGEGTEGLDSEQFIAKLKQNEAALCRKYNARSVRFKVIVKGNQTTLKPVPLI